MSTESRLFKSLQLVENMSESDFNGRSFKYNFFVWHKRKIDHLLHFRYSTFVNVIDFRKCTHIELSFVSQLVFNTRC